MNLFCLYQLKHPKSIAYSLDLLHLISHKPPLHHHWVVYIVNRFTHHAGILSILIVAIACVPHGTGRVFAYFSESLCRKRARLNNRSCLVLELYSLHIVPLLWCHRAEVASQEQRFFLSCRRMRQMPLVIQACKKCSFSCIVFLFNR